MQTSEAYKQIISRGNYQFEQSLVIGDGTPDTGLRENRIRSIEIDAGCFDGDNPAVGCAPAATVAISIYGSISDVPRKAKLRPYVRVVDDLATSEWIPQGIYWADTREGNVTGTNLKIVDITGFDALIFADAPYPSDSSHAYPLRDIDMVQFIAGQLGCGVAADTIAKMIHGYKFPLPLGYTMREVLQMIAGCYGGNFVCDLEGNLLLLLLGELPPETRYLVDHSGNAITFGGARILI